MSSTAKTREVEIRDARSAPDRNVRDQPRSAGTVELEDRGETSCDQLDERQAGEVAGSLPEVRSRSEACYARNLVSRASVHSGSVLGVRETGGLERALGRR